MIYDISENNLNTIFDSLGNEIDIAYDLSDAIVFKKTFDLPVPYGNLVANSVVELPDIYNNGHGWTCTGLTYDGTTDTFLIGDIGKVTPSSSGFESKLIRVSSDFVTVIEQIPLYSIFPNMNDVQGVAIDASDGTIWFCSTSENLIRCIDDNGNSVKSISISGSPTGITYSNKDDSFWILTYASTNNIKHINKSGLVLEQYTFNYAATLDQCFLDAERGYLYITAGDNYSNINNVYLFDVNTHAQSIVCTVDSYSVEGLWIGKSDMVIVNDGYYHSAAVPVNQVNIYDISHSVYEAAHSTSNIFAGGLIEIQPDSWDGSTPVTGDIVQPTDPTAWGFPMLLSNNANTAIKRELLTGNGHGISFIRLPMGFGYRGYRNIDVETGLSKNIGERFVGQNESLRTWFANIAQSGGGLDVEYWCPAPYWLTGGAYYNASVNNELWAGGNYSRTTTLSSIKTSDPTQYAKQIDDFTDAVVNDLEYVHQNICPVRMYTMAAEPTQNGKKKFGHCQWPKQLYNDVFEVLHPKVMSSAILSTYNDKENVVLMHLCADCEGFAIGSTMINNHSEWIWGYSHDVMQPVNGETGIGADLIKGSTWPTGSKSSWKNVFMCEYEYFSVSSKTPEFRCGNNIVRMILELAYRKAKIIMPIIHICKPQGQTSSDTNTTGYCLYSIDMDDGTYSTNDWAYNSWKMFNDNLPVGAEFVSGGDGGLSYAGYVEFKYRDKLYIFLGNYSSSAQTITLSFDTSRTFEGLLYNLTNLGTAVPAVSGSTIAFTIPAYSGLAYLE